MNDQNTRQLISIIPSLRQKARDAMLLGESWYNIEQALESELIQFIQIIEENESLQFVIDNILKSLSNDVGILESRR